MNESADSITIQFNPDINQLRLTSGGGMTTKRILFVASLVLIPFLVRFVRKRNGKEPQIAI
jgi:hypothetical protein